MCGRYSLVSDMDALLDELGDLEAPENGLAPRYNVAPTQAVAVVTNREATRIRMHHFGLVPHWAKDPSIAHRLINARRETVAEKPSFRDAYRRKRCLVLADGFYEWKRDGRRKQPVLIRLASGHPFTFAGLWAVWHDPNGHTLPSCCIVTAPAQGPVADVHDRMPVIVPPALRSAWLAPEPRDPEELGPLLDATPAGDLVIRPVTSYVSSPMHEGPACWEPAEQS
jgi:putative SOS response-associated peptidase YedK